MNNIPGMDNVAVTKAPGEPTVADVVTQATSIDRGDLHRITKSLIDITVERQDALNAAEDQEVRLWFATAVLNVLEEHPDATTLDLVDWEDEVEGGDPFDVAIGSVYDAQGEQITEGTDGAISIRHHWVLDELRVDPDAAHDNKYHPGHRLSAAKSVAWLHALLTEQL